MPYGAPGATVVRTFNTHPLANSYVRPGILLAPEIQARESALGCAANFQAWEGDSAAILGDIFRELAAHHWSDACVCGSRALFSCNGSARVTNSLSQLAW